MVFDLEEFQKTFKKNRDIADWIGKINILKYNGMMIYQPQPTLGDLINYYDELDSFLRESWRQMTLDDKNAVNNIISNRMIEIGNDISKDPKSKEHIALQVPDMKYIMQYIPQYKRTIQENPMKAQNEMLILQDIMYAINTCFYERNANPETCVE